MSAETENQFNFTPKAHISISRVDHNTSIMKSVDDIFQKQLFTDVCLSCENQIINAHRLILAASTSFFHSLFSNQPCCLNPHPVIVIRDMKINELKAILEFCYYGSVSIPETELDSLIKSAESLGVYGLSKLNTNQINELREDDQEHEINNNSINNNKTTLTLRNSPQQQVNNNNKDQSTTRSSLLNKSNQSNKTSPTTNLNNKNTNVDKIKRKLINNVVEDEQNIKDLEEKRKKKELIEQYNVGKSISNNTTTNSIQQQSTSEQSSSSKRQSLRIRDRKTNPDSTKDDILNTSNNSEILLSEMMSSNGKRLKRANSDSNLNVDDDLMSVDGSEYNMNKETTNQNNLQDRKTESKSEKTTNLNNGKSLLSNKMTTTKVLALRRNRLCSKSILKKQPDQSKSFKLKLMLGKMNANTSKVNSDLGLKSNELINESIDNDLLSEENIILKKIDSPASSLSTSRKNSLDSNNGSFLKMSRSSNDKHQETNESTSNNQSLLATSSLAKSSQQQKNKKKRRISIDNGS